MVKLRAAKRGDYELLYGSPPKWSMRAITAEIDDIPVGIGGYFFGTEGILVFSIVKDELRKYPYAIYKGARQIAKMVKDSGLPVIAYADPKIDRAGPLLEHLGFEYVNTSSRGEVYTWNPETLQIS